MCTEMMSDRLQAEADPKQGTALGCTAGDECEGYARLFRPPGPRGDQKSFCAAGQRLLRAHLVIADDGDVRAKHMQIVDEVPGKAVVIVDDEDGRAGFRLVAWRRR